jgi:hypothetical protein
MSIKRHSNAEPASNGTDMELLDTKLRRKTTSQLEKAVDCYDKLNVDSLPATAWFGREDSVTRLESRKMRKNKYLPDFVSPKIHSFRNAPISANRQSKEPCFASFAHHPCRNPLHALGVNSTSLLIDPYLRTLRPGGFKCNRHICQIAKAM